MRRHDVMTLGLMSEFTLFDYASLDKEIALADK